MKKNKLLYVFGLSTVALALASCGGSNTDGGGTNTDLGYRSKNFNIAEPTKDDLATVAYDTVETQSELFDFYIDRNKSMQNNKTKKTEFFNKYLTISNICVNKEIITKDSKENGATIEQKSIFDTKNGNLYYYEHDIVKEDSFSSDFTMETNVYNKDGQYVILTDMNFKDISFELANGTGDASVYKKRATGSLKYSYTIESKDNLNTALDTIYNSNYVIGSAICVHISPQGPDLLCYSNTDKSYVYSSYNFVKKDEAGEVSVTDKDLFVRKDSLITYQSRSRYDKAYNNEIGNVRDMSYIYSSDYIEEALLDTTFDSTGYETFDSAWITKNMEKAYMSFSPFIFTKLPCRIGGASSLDYIRALLEQEEVQAKLTIVNI